MDLCSPRGTWIFRGEHDLCFLCLDQSEVRILLRRSLIEHKPGSKLEAKIKSCQRSVSNFWSLHSLKLVAQRLSSWRKLPKDRELTGPTCTWKMPTLRSFECNLWPWLKKPTNTRLYTHTHTHTSTRTRRNGCLHLTTGSKRAHVTEFVFVYPAQLTVQIQPGRSKDDILLISKVGE